MSMVKNKHDVTNDLKKKSRKFDTVDDCATIVNESLKCWTHGSIKFLSVSNRLPSKPLLMKNNYEWNYTFCLVKQFAYP